MEKKTNLTNEKLSRKFVSQFEMVNFAIRLAEEQIYSHDAHTKNGAESFTGYILEEMSHEKDLNSNLQRTGYSPMTEISPSEEDFLIDDEEIDEDDDEFETEADLVEEKIPIV